MRTLDFGEDLTLSSDGKPVVKNRLSLRSKILAYLAFPESSEHRTQLLAACGAQYLQQLGDSVGRESMQTARETGHDADALHQHLQNHYAFLMERLLKESELPFGGSLGDVATAAFDKSLEASVNAGLRDATRAGYRLLFTAIMALHHDKELPRGASAGKAIDLTVWLGDKSKVLKSRFPVEQAWRSHKSVAHLSAAAILIGCVIRSAAPPTSSLVIPLRPVLENMEEFLKLSQDFLDFGVTFKAFGSTKKILDADTLWRLPIRMASLPLKPALFRLSDEQLSFLRDVRRAPVPII